MQDKQLEINGIVKTVVEHYTPLSSNPQSILYYFTTDTVVQDIIKAFQKSIEIWNKFHCL